jgi:hypothetical protein
MAYSVVKAPQMLEAHGLPASLVRIGSLTAGLEENIVHSGPTETGAEPIYCYYTVVAPPTSNDPVYFTWLKDDSSLTNGTVRVKFDTAAGGDLTGAEVELRVVFPVVKGGGISA